MMIRCILFFLFSFLLFTASALPIKGDVGATENEPQQLPDDSKGMKARDLPDTGSKRHFDCFTGHSLCGRRKRLAADPHISARKKRQQRHDSMRKRRSINSAGYPKESFALREDFTIMPSI